MIVNGKEKLIRRRKRKSHEQMEVLAQEFARDSDWSKKRLHELHLLTGLSESQIYKWGWDQRKKMIEEGGVPIDAFPL